MGEGFGAGLLFENFEAFREREFFLQQLLAFLREVCEPTGVFGTEGGFHFFAEAAGEGRAGSSGGDGDLQLAAADHRGVVEVAEGWDVDDVAEHVALAGFTVDGVVDFGRIGGGNDEEHVVEVGGTKGALG